MATDTLFDKVRVLVQGASSANQAIPMPAPSIGAASPVQFTVSGVGSPPVGADHVVLTSHAIGATVKKSVLSKTTVTKGKTAGGNWNWRHTVSPSIVTVEMVLEINPAWPVGALIAKFYGLEITIESAGLLRFRSYPSTSIYEVNGGRAPVLGQSFTKYIGNTPGKVYIACVMRMEASAYIEAPYDV